MRVSAILATRERIVWSTSEIRVWTRKMTAPVSRGARTRDQECTTAHAIPDTKAMGSHQEEIAAILLSVSAALVCMVEFVQKVHATMMAAQRRTHVRAHWDGVETTAAWT